MTEKTGKGSAKPHKERSRPKSSATRTSDGIVLLSGGNPLDLHRFCFGQVLVLGGPLFEGHG
jgi:hypothetical protein